MKQILQNVANGETQLVEAPFPQNKSGQLLISTTKSLVSVGTEGLLIDFGKSGWIQKARSQPDKVKMVLGKVKTDGLMPTIDTVGLVGACVGSAFVFNGPYKAVLISYQRP